MIVIWGRGLLRRRRAYLAAAATGVGIAVALLASLGAFLVAAEVSMTERAAAGVAVDWQVQVAPGSDPATVLDAVRAAPGVVASAPVAFAGAEALTAVTAATTQTTGAATLVGLPDGYRSMFPGEMRTLVGADEGVLLAQQTAANLHVAPGDTIQVVLPGRTPTSVPVDGVVELTAADSLFQHVGAPPAGQPTAPPDNVVVLPGRRLADMSAAGGDQVSVQVHAAYTRALPADPATAYTAVTTAAHNLEARAAGAALVGDNLASALDSARSDAAYARILFLFLGTPGAVLAGLLTSAVTGAAAERRRREQALLRTRGASAAQLTRLAFVDAAIVGAAGSLAGLGTAAVLGSLVFGSTGFAATTTSLVSVVTAVAAGLVIAALTVVVAARRDQRTITVAAARAAAATRPKSPQWARSGLDVVVLMLAAVVFWISGLNGNTLVVAPEGTPAIAVSYWAFAGPALLWLGIGLVTWRLVDLALGHGRRLLATAMHPLTGNLSTTVAAALARRRRPLARSIVLLALAGCFAISTATFDATYRQQAEVDALLTNGADVTVTEAPGAAVPPAAGATLATVAGVAGVEPLQHRFAYIGADLQDLYGVRPATIGGVTALQDAYFEGGSSRQLMDALAARPDSVLVSAETVTDFQLQPGDLIKLRLPDSRTGQLTEVPFHYAGIVKEFPTAPNDSFLVADADYVARSTGSDAVGAFLVDTAGADTVVVADRIRALLGPGPTVTDMSAARGRVGSSLTSVELAGLTRVELGFAFLLAVAAGGLVLALGFGQRRRSFAIAAALGASRRQLRGFLFGEAAVVTLGGLLFAAIGGSLLSSMLVAVLTGVFDPPPSAVAVPWPYLAAVTVLAVAAVGVAVAVTEYVISRPAPWIMREL
ncbi:FtsX-like permease family protein [Pseudonocardia sp. DLS-67]